MEFMKNYRTLSIQQMLLLTLSSMLIVWLAHYWWKRRNLYRLAAKIPGPPGYPLIGNGLDFYNVSNTDIMEYAKNLFKNYPVIGKIWLGPELIISISKPEDIETVYNSPECLGRDIFYKFTKLFFGNGLLTAPVNIWKRHRKLINPTFTPKILESFFDVFNDQTRVAVQLLKDKLADEDFDANHILNTCYLEMICETALGIKTNLRDTADNFRDWMITAMRLVVVRISTIWYHSDFVFRLSSEGKYLDELPPKLNDFTEKVLNEKKKRYEETQKQLEAGHFVEDENKWKCFLEHLFEISDTEGKLTDTEIRDEVNTIMATGSDTIATAVCFCMLTLALNPDIQRRVYEEVIDILGNDRDVTPKDVSKLPYLKRCIKESLRLLPTLPLSLRRTAADIDLGHSVVPAQSIILLGMIHNHRSPEYWKDPLKFDPDRFLPEEVAKRHPYAYFPFGAGQRNCIGSKYAMMVITISMVHILRNFVLKTTYKSVEEVKLSSEIVSRVPEGYKLILQIRK